MIIETSRASRYVRKTYGIDGEGGNRSVVKVWERHAYRDYDGEREPGTRDINASRYKSKAVAARTPFPLFRPIRICRRFFLQIF